MKLIVMALLVLVVTVSVAHATPPPRQATRAKHAYARELLLKCAHGNMQACNKLDRLLSP